MEHNQHSIKRIANGFDRQNLSTIRKRFLAINAQRCQRLYSALDEQQQKIIEVLALLFHYNHPMLPGFCGRQCPNKISNFTPEKSALQSLRSFARSFTETSFSYEDCAIDAIYLMGSVGSIAQSRGSDIDIWLCHSPDLKTQELKLLQKKASAIADWAQRQRLDLHIFLMNAEAFCAEGIAGMDQESSGSAQRLLLLDEFYRSSIYLAGKIPLWWYVPPADEQNYSEHCARLIKQKYLPGDPVIDFGSVANVPAEEFIGAAIWQLYKAIDAPYKSVLKLLLLEVYVSQWPDIQTLALDFKRRIYDGDTDIDQLDAYVLTYRRIERYLLTHKQKLRLELARHCFYFKVGRAMSKCGKRSSARPWQQQAMKQLLEQWAWSQPQLQKLDARKHWKAETVKDERKLLVRELNFAYQSLLDFAQQQHSDIQIDAGELNILGRKLQAAFEQRADKVEWINPGISRDLSESSLGLEKNQQQWQLLATERDNKTVLHRAASLIQLVLWACYNGVCDEQSLLQSNWQIENSRLQRIRQLLLRWLPSQRQAKHRAFNHAARCDKLLLLINSELTNKHSYSTQTGEQLVHGVDCLSLNTWLELQNRHFSGERALVDAACYVLSLSLGNNNKKRVPKLEIHCLSQQRSQYVEQKSQQWFDDLYSVFFSHGSEQQRYAFSWDGHWYCLQRQGEHLRTNAFTSEQALIQSFSQPQSLWSPLHIDRNCLQDSALPLIAEKLKRNCIHVFYRHYDIGTRCYIADEKGSIIQLSLRGDKTIHNLKTLQFFLRNVVKRQCHLEPQLLEDFGVCPIYFYRIQKHKNAALSLRQQQIEYRFGSDSEPEIKAYARMLNGQLHYDFEVDSERMQNDEAQQLYSEVATKILRQRTKRRNQTICLSDLDLSLVRDELALDGAIQSSHYLQLKAEIEEQLNNAAQLQHAPAQQPPA
ncbi:class I adenylate cyclase [Agaribacterium haliotis]|uniref:class I adenylate cyclase n=1 Tax=Agaribacterium haliotis TaxID=2013869 RepID=UPI000BB53038|nr:class I adenylate cyclase [Agaribacterium haliotis]